MKRILFCCLMCFQFFISKSQNPSKNELGISASYGVHSNLISADVDGYSLFGCFSSFLWYRFNPKNTHIEFEPGIGLNSNNFNYRLSEQNERLSIKFFYAELSLNATFNIKRKSGNRLITGIYFDRLLLTDLLVVENGVDGKNQIQFTGELDRIYEESDPNLLNAGFNLGYRRNMKKLKRFSFELILKQSIVDLYSNDVVFKYLVNKTNNEKLTINGKPSNLMFSLRYALI